MADATDNALAQANAQMASVREMVAALEVDYDLMNEIRESGCTLTDWHDGGAEQLAELESQAGDCESQDDAIERITTDALCTEVRSEWHNPHNDSEGPTEFRIVLCTGGPHVQIRGELDRGEPSSAWLEYQDWGTPMTKRVNEHGDQDALLAYARQFYLGE